MSLKFNDNNTHRDKTQATHMNSKITKIKWDPDKQHHFINELKSPAVNQQLDDLLKELENDVIFVVRVLSSILCKNAQSMLKTVIIRHGEAHSKPTWFDKECYQYKRVVRQSLHKYSNNPNEANKKTYVSLRRDYKILLKSKRLLYSNSKILSVCSNIKNSSVFWREINSVLQTPTSSNNIPVHEWHTFFIRLFQQNTTPAPI